MKRLWSLILLCLFVSVSAIAAEKDDELGFWFEVQAVSGDNPSKIIGWYEKDLTDSFGFYVLAEKESADKYRQFYIGPTWRISPWLQVGVGIGREVMTGLNSVRKNFFFDANIGKVNAFGTFETGESGPWHKATLTYAFTEKFGAGLINETGFGNGLRAEFNTKIERKKTQFWIAGFDEETFMLAVNISF